MATERYRASGKTASVVSVDAKELARTSGTTRANGDCRASRSPDMVLLDVDDPRRGNGQDRLKPATTSAKCWRSRCCRMLAGRRTCVDMEDYGAMTADVLTL